jgi:hypothetical protein
MCIHAEVGSNGKVKVRERRHTLYEYRSVFGSHWIRSWALNLSRRTRSVSRGVLVTIAISCKRIGLGVDYRIRYSSLGKRHLATLTDFKVVHCINKLSIDIETSACISGLGVYDIYDTVRYQALGKYNMDMLDFGLDFFFEPEATGGVESAGSEGAGFECHDV